MFSWLKKKAVPKVAEKSAYVRPYPYHTPTPVPQTVVVDNSSSVMDALILSQLMSGHSAISEPAQTYSPSVSEDRVSATPEPASSGSSFDSSPVYDSPSYDSPSYDSGSSFSSSSD